MSPRLFHIPVSVHLALEVTKKAQDFASKVVSTVDYSDSNQRSKSKIRRDHYVSKIGEEAARAAFLLFTKEVSEPDYSIYHGQRKSWSPDLRVDGINLAIKTQTRSSSRKYGLSWTFQNSNGRRDPILNQPDSWVCFVEFNDLSREGIECIVFPPFRIKELQFRAPVLSYLKDSKKVVYAADIEKQAHRTGSEV